MMYVTDFDIMETLYKITPPVDKSSLSPMTDSVFEKAEFPVYFTWAPARLTRKGIAVETEIKNVAVKDGKVLAWFDDLANLRGRQTEVEKTLDEINDDLDKLLFTITEKAVELWARNRTRRQPKP